MSISSDSAEQTVRFTLEGIEVIAKISGEGAKNAIALICAALKSKEQTKGKTRLNNMLKSGKELKIFSIRQDDLKMFAKEAKRYGVLYSALINKLEKSKDGMVDIMVRSEDAGKINRIVERFKISTVKDTAKIETEILKSQNIAKAEKDLDVEKKDNQVKESEKIELEPIKKDKNEFVELPLVKEKNRKILSKSSLEMLKESEGNTTKPKRKSVREEMKEIKLEMEKIAKRKKKEKVMDSPIRNGRNSR